MQDAKRIHEQVSEMTTRAQARLDVSQGHLKRVEERKPALETEVTKFRFLVESLVAAEQILQQRRKALEAQPQVPPAALGGLDQAVEMVRDLQRQGRENAARSEGKFQMLQQLEQELRQEVVEATSRTRGLEVQGARAVDLASRPAPAPVAGEIPATENGGGGETPLLEALGGAATEDAKEPIGASRKRTAKNGATSRKTEH